MRRLLPISTLFPYTTLFRSPDSGGAVWLRDALAASRPARGGMAGHGGRDGKGVRKVVHAPRGRWRDRKSTRLNSSHANISYAVFCLKKKKHMINVTIEVDHI